MQEVVLFVLNVGQGLCSVVSGIKDDGNPYCGIFDCGTLEYNPKFNKDATLANIKELIEITGEKVITDIVISHQDIDHWSLLMDILSDYFDMPKGQIYRKNKFLCTMEMDGIELFAINEPNLGYAHYEAMFENDYNRQTISYALRDDELVSSFYYEGIFYEVGQNWEITASICRFVGNCNLRLLHVGLVCNEDTGDEIAKTDYQVPIPFMQMEECLQKVGMALSLAKEKFRDMYLEAHIITACFLMREHRYSFSKIEEFVTSVPDETWENPIERFVWGGAEPSSKCRAAQELIKLMSENGLIGNFKTYPYSGYVKFEHDELRYTEAMTFQFYDSDMVDAHGETIHELNIKRNVTSVVACMKFKDQMRLLFPGDITVHRFELLVETVKDEISYAKSIMLAPHHGSDVTNFPGLPDGSSSYPIEPLHSLLSLFAKDEEKIFVVSAFLSKFGHPGYHFMMEAIKCASDGDSHKVCYWNEDQGKEVREEIVRDVFCTEMEQEQYGLHFSYSAPENAVCSERKREPRGQCKAPSKRLFI